MAPRKEAQLPFLTAPFRGFALDPECSLEDADAEFHGAYALRGAKLRVGHYVEVWLTDKKMPTEYKAIVKLLGFRYHSASEELSVYELVADVMFTLDHEMCKPSTHDLVDEAHYIPYISSPPPNGTKVVWLTNWFGTIALKNMRDPVSMLLLKAGATPLPGRAHLAGHAEMSGGWSTVPNKARGAGRKRRKVWLPRKVRRAVPADHGEEQLLSELPARDRELLPTGKPYILTAINVNSMDSTTDPPPMLNIKRDTGGFIERTGVGPGKPLQLGATLRLAFAIRTPNGSICIMDGAHPSPCAEYGQDQG
jgi:hypothetical protein